jgi:hypothetical protein
MLAPEYDVSIQEASQSSEEKQETAMILGGYADKLLVSGDLQTGKAFLAEALNHMRLDGDALNRLTQLLVPQQEEISPQQFMQMQQQLQQLQQFIQSGEVEKTRSETEKNLAQAAKTLKDADLSTVQVPKVRAETARTLEEANRTAIEAQRAAATPIQDVSVTV